MPSEVTNIVIAGLGGQGAIKASDILAEVAFAAGLDVKKSEIHGMSQRGGSVSSEVRFGTEVLSPMVPPGEADYMIVLDPSEVDVNRPNLRAGGVLIDPGLIRESDLSNKRSLNVALLGAVSEYLSFDRSLWVEAICANLAKKLHEANLQAFEVGRSAARAR